MFGKSITAATQWWKFEGKRMKIGILIQYRVTNDGNFKQISE